MALVDVTALVSNIMIHLTRRRLVYWNPSLFQAPLVITANPENLHMQTHGVEVITAAVEKVTAIERIRNIDEFNSLAELPSTLHIYDLFGGAIMQRFLPSYSALNLIRYMSYVSSFSIIYYRVIDDGHHLPDYAALVIIGAINRERDFFSRMESWDQLINEAERINRPDYIHIDI